MAPTAETLAAGTRLTDHISMGVLIARFPRAIVVRERAEAARQRVLERALPAHVMVYSVIALALYAEVLTQDAIGCVVEGARCFGDPITSEGLGALLRARDPDARSCTHTLQVTRRTLPQVAASGGHSPPGPPML